MRRKRKILKTLRPRKKYGEPIDGYGTKTTSSGTYQFTLVSGTINSICNDCKILNPDAFDDCRIEFDSAVRLPDGCLHQFPGTLHMLARSADVADGQAQAVLVAEYSVREEHFA